MKRSALRTLVTLGLVVIVGGLLTQSVAAEEITFTKQVLDETFRSEGVAVGDFNNDGRLDIAANNVYFAAPNFEMKQFETKVDEFNPKGYSNSFCNFSADINGDGYDDLIIVDFPGKQTWWLQNPGETDAGWKRHVGLAETNNESPGFYDADGDGRRELLAGLSAGRIGVAMPNPNDPTAEWTVLPASTAEQVKQKAVPQIQRFYHGLGLGDINGDGRQDILVPNGWWEAPADLKSAESWTFHPAPFGPACSQMYAYDFDGDGDNDVLSSSAHNYGIWWYEQTPEGWKQHEIDRRYSQTHALVLADINGDGLMDFVTGKRWWAHNGNDPGGNDPPVLYWYELTRENGRPVWKPHVIDHASGVGTQFEVADVNGDGLLDIAVSNKRGTFYFEQKRK